MGGFSAGDILFILLVGGIVAGLLVMVGLVRKKPETPATEDSSEEETKGT